MYLRKMSDHYKSALTMTFRVFSRTKVIKSYRNYSREQYHSRFGVRRWHILQSEKIREIFNDSKSFWISTKKKS